MTTQDLKYVPEDTSMFSGVIYGLYHKDSPHEFRYIGKTQRDLKTRFRRHLSNARSGKPWAVSKWIRKHGPENIRVCVLATFDDTNVEWIDDREKFYIAQYSDIILSANLNLTEGGDGSTGYKHTPETKAKISAIHKGRNLSPEALANIREGIRAAITPEYREKQRIGSTGRKHTLEAKAKISKAHKGKVVTPETKAKISAAKKGKTLTAEHRAKLSDANKGKPNAGVHVRLHINKNIFKEGCVFCDEEILMVLQLM